MHFINNYTDALLVGKTIYKQSDKHEIKYFNVVHSISAPQLITPLIANEMFANQGGDCKCIYVVKPFQQEIFAKENFSHFNKLIKVTAFTKAPQEDIETVKFYIMQFMGYNNFSTEVIQATSFFSAKKHLMKICSTPVIANLIVAKTIQTIKL